MLENVRVKDIYAECQSVKVAGGIFVILLISCVYDLEISRDTSSLDGYILLNKNYVRACGRAARVCRIRCRIYLRATTGGQQHTSSLLP